DGFEQLVAIHRDGVPAVRYACDSLGRRSSVAVDGSGALRYHYDVIGRIDRIGTPSGDITYHYQLGQGFVERRLPSGTRTIWEYSPSGALLTLSHAAPTNRVLIRFRYSYLPDGRVQKVEEESAAGRATVSYEYDSRQRLAAVTDSRTGTIRYR